jgi:hypothetical protein
MQTKEQQGSLEEAQAVSNDTTIDLGNYGAACETISIDSLTSPDIITLGPSMTYSSGSTCYGHTVISGINTNNSYGWPSSNYTINSGLSNQANVVIDTDGINIKGDGDIKVKGRSLSEFMTKMEQRMAILVPDPDKLEKFEALKKAYEHYKTMESLCFDEPDEET